MNSLSTDGVEYTDFCGLAILMPSVLFSSSLTSAFDPSGWCEPRDSKLNVRDVVEALRLGFLLEDADASDKVELRRLILPRLRGLLFSSFSIGNCLDRTCRFAVSERLFRSRFLWIGTLSFIISSCGSNVTDPCEPCVDSMCCL